MCLYNIIKMSNTINLLLTISGIIIALIGSCHCIKKFSSICFTIEISDSNNPSIIANPITSAIIHKISPRKNPSLQVHNTEVPL